MATAGEHAEPSDPSGVDGLVAVVDRLLDPDGGCVWNRAQTHASLATYAVEESYELVDAIDSGDLEELREELGDVLYQVVLHAGIAARAGEFDLDDVAAAVRDKMVRRHPHVFGDETADTLEDVVRVWRAAKAVEKSERRSVFDGVPRAMPPLERAVKLLERIDERAVGRTASDPDGDVGAVGAAAAVVEDLRDAAVGTAVAGGADGHGALDPAWGAAMLAQVAEARSHGVDPIASLRAAVAALEQNGRAREV